MTSFVYQFTTAARYVSSRLCCEHRRTDVSRDFRPNCMLKDGKDSDSAVGGPRMHVNKRERPGQSPSISLGPRNLPTDSHQATVKDTGTVEEPNENSHLLSPKVTSIGTWNVRTLFAMGAVTVLTMWTWKTALGYHRSIGDSLDRGARKFCQGLAIKSLAQEQQTAIAQEFG